MNKNMEPIAEDYTLPQLILLILMGFSLVLSFAAVTNIVHEIGITPNALDMLTPITMKNPQDCTLRKMIRMGSDVGMAVCYNPTKAENLRYTLEKDRQQETYLQPITFVSDICLGIWSIAGIVFLWVRRISKLRTKTS